jgi:hypothetical protein
MTMTRTIEVLFFAGCPNVDLAVARARAAIRTSRIDANVVAIDMASADSRKAERFGGSPTVLVDGVDVDGSPEDGGDRVRCRVYEVDGRLDGAPSVEKIAAALRGEPNDGKPEARAVGDCCRSRGEPTRSDD